MKPTVSAVLAATLGLSVLAGCSTTAKDSTQTGTGEEGNKGRTPISMSIRILNGPPEFSQNINEEKWLKKMEELANVDLTLKPMPHKEFDQKMAQMFATNDIPDVVQGYTLTGKDMGGSVEAGIFMPLDELQKHAPNLMKKIPKEAWEGVKYNGKIYAIPDVLNHTSRRGTYIRMDLLKKTGLPVPKTVDEYITVSCAFKKLE